MSFKKKISPAKNAPNRKRGQKFPYDGLVSVNRRAHERADMQLGKNRKLNQRAGKSVWASIALEDIEIEQEEAAGFIKTLTRWFLALLLLPFCWVTSWTFLKTFSHATMEQGFWQTPQFWYFTIGALVMLGWFTSKLAQPFFLYLYVFGHELTHAVFVKCFGGKVYDMEWGTSGGYVTTDKSNWVISLSPYFVPFWSLIAVILYAVPSFFWKLPGEADLFFYEAVGASWSFHMAWTIWMIPRDQPDLKDNGTFLSLVLIYFGNLVVLIGLLCFASPNPFESLRDFGYTWFGTAMTWGDRVIQWFEQWMTQIPSYL